VRTGRAALALPGLASRSGSDPVVALFMAAAALGHVDVWPAGFPGFSVGDALLAWMVPLVGRRLSAPPSVPRLPRSVLALSVYWVWALAGYIVFSARGDPVFSDVEWAKSFLKLTYHLTAGFVFLLYLARADPARVERAVLNVLAAVSLIALYIYTVMTLRLPLPYAFFWFNQPAETIVNTFFARGSGFVVARGMFSEPSFLGIFLNLGWAVCLFMTTGAPRGPWWKHLVVLTAILLTFSLSAYLLLLANVAAMLVAAGRRARRTAVAVLVVGTAILIPAVPQFAEAIAGRAGEVLGGRDPSANARVFGSWEPVRWYLRESPVIGVGLGQYDIAQARILTPLRYEQVIRDREGWNGLAYALGTTGVVGAAALVLVQIDLLVRNPIGGAFFAIMLFLRGDLLSLAVWVFYALLHYQGRVNRDLSGAAQPADSAGRGLRHRRWASSGGHKSTQTS
jgi:hypothetical protein